MTGYLFTIILSALGYVIQSMQNLEKTEFSKYQRFQKWTHIIMMIFGLLGWFSSRFLFDIVSTTVQFIMCVVLTVTLSVAIVLQVLALRLLLIKSWKG